MTDQTRLCSDCPRRCGAPRSLYKGAGFCNQGDHPCLARAALHFHEEPCISGASGSGAVFFTGCSLRCAYCQNGEISKGGGGVPVTPGKLREIFKSLEAQGAHNINLVTPSHFTRAIDEALAGAQLEIPVVYNSSGYDAVPALQSLRGLIDVYMPDLKYLDPALAARYSAAPDYPETAKAALDEMFTQAGPPIFDEDGLLKRGLLIRHLMLPGHLGNTLDVIDYVAAHFPKEAVLFSLMCQYTPMPWSPPELSGPVTADEYAGAVSYLRLAGITQGYLQEPGAVGREFIPAFDGSGIPTE